MGGGGRYYSRDVTDSSRKDSRGISDFAEEIMSRSDVDKALLPYDRKLACQAKSPIAYPFDHTGSMGDLPKMLCDRMPNIVGELARCEYLEDPMMSIAAVGDIFSDGSSSIQICDFSPIRSLDEWLQRIYLGRGGGGQAKESYEFVAYFYARMVELPNAVTPIFLFTGDEGFYENLLATDLKKHFGGTHEKIIARDVFDELKKKFQGNVFLLHPTHAHYGQAKEKEIVAQWEETLGKEKVIKLRDKSAIADVTLGIFALTSGRTLDEYIEDIKNRPLDLGDGVKYKPQSQERIDEVRKSLEVFAAAVASRTPKTKSGAKLKEPPKTSGRKKKENSEEFPTL